MLTDLSIAMKNILCAALAGVVLISCMNEQAATTTATLQTQRDWENKSDARGQREPALRSDEKVIQLIRHSLSADKSLPTNGKGVRLIVSDGMITLRGLVTSEQEKVSIGTMARQYAGARDIDNQLEVAN
jgi:osmotically-inducible protein OsmY